MSCKTLLLPVLLGLGLTAKAQHPAYNPFADEGYKPKIATLSKGKYQEFHDIDTVVQIGHALFHTRNFKLIGFVKEDTVYSESTLEPELISRWLSPDPLSSEFPSWSPYNYGNCNPIYFVDPDGKAVVASTEFLKGRNTMSAFQLLIASILARNYLSQFASTHGIYTTETPGELSRHDIKFTADLDEGFGLTTLFIKNADGSVTEFDEGVTLTDDVSFSIQIALKQWGKESEKNTGFNSSTLNHEVFAHTQILTEILMRWEDRANNGMTIVELQSQLIAWQNQTDQEHADLTAGKNKQFNQVYKEQRQELQRQIQNAKTPEEAKALRKTLAGLNVAANQDVTGISKEP